MKIGVISLGDIAQKAYLPVLSGLSGYEFHLYSRDQQKLQQVGARYRFSNLHTSFDSLLTSGIEAAFVHAATDAHFELVSALLNHNIHVYVEKPLTLHYEQSKELVELAAQKNLLLAVGFNRRFAPVYQSLKSLPDPSMVIMQKNRKGQPDEARRFILDDFIHVVDTLRYLFPYPVADLHVNGRQQDGLLYQVVVQLVAPGGQIAIGIMNRDSGHTEEKVEVMNATEKRVVYNVADLVVQQDKTSTHAGSNDWEPTLHKRGFEQMIANFLEAVAGKTTPAVAAQDALLTHLYCEQIVEALNAQPANK